MAALSISPAQLNKMLSSQLSKTQDKFNKLTAQITSGVKVSSMKDDAVAAKSIIKTDNELADIATYKSNLSSAGIELSQTDSTLASVNDQLQKVYDLAMTVSNGTAGATQIEAYKQELDSLIDNVKRLANTQYGDIYLFSGTRTTTPPYVEDSTGLAYGGDSGARNALIADNKSEQINLIGEDVFGKAIYTTDDETGYITVDSAASSGIFASLYKMKEAMQDTSNVNYDSIKEVMGSLKNGMDNKITASRTKVGVLGSSFEDMNTAYDNDVLNLTQLKSNLQDTDLPSAISDWYSVYQSMQASYSMMSQTMDISLLNYI